MIHAIAEAPEEDLMVIKRESLGFWQRSSHERPEIGGVSGIYFLFLGEDLMYVGKSNNIAGRIFNNGYHFEWDRFAYKACSLEDLDYEEALYIGLYRPRHNSQVRKMAKDHIRSALEKRANAPESED